MANSNSVYLLLLYLMVLDITCHYLADALRRLLGRLLEVILDYARRSSRIPFLLRRHKGT